MPFTFFWNRKKNALKKEINDLNQELVSLKGLYNNDRNILEEEQLAAQLRLIEQKAQTKRLQQAQDKAFQSLEEEKACNALLKQDLDLKNATIEDLKEKLEQLLLSNDVKDQLTLKKNVELSDADEKMKSLEERLASERHQHKKQMEELKKKMAHVGARFCLQQKRQILKEREDPLQKKMVHPGQILKELEDPLQKKMVHPGQILKELEDPLQKKMVHPGQILKELEDPLQEKMVHPGQILKELEDPLQEKQTTIAQSTKDLEEQECLNHRPQMKTSKMEWLKLATEIKEQEMSVQSACQATEEVKSSLQDEGNERNQNLPEVSRTENQTKFKTVLELREKYEHKLKSSLQDGRNERNERNENLLEGSGTENQTRFQTVLELKEKYEELREEI